MLKTKALHNREPCSPGGTVVHVGEIPVQEQGLEER